MSTGERRVDTHGAVERGAPITIEIDGEVVGTYVGETLAAAMLAAGRRIFRRSPRTGSPRGVYCGIGICYECQMVVDGRTNVRACVTPVRDGMCASTQRGPAEGVSPVPSWP